MQEDKIRYSVDKHGVVGPSGPQEPVSGMPDLGSVGIRKSLLERERDAEFLLMQNTLDETTRLTRPIGKTTRFIRSKLQELNLPTPGLMEVDSEEGIYTGWFYVEGNNGPVPVFASSKLAGQDLPQSGRELGFPPSSPFFQLSARAARMWDERIRTQQPLTREEYAALIQGPGYKSSKIYTTLASLSLSERNAYTRELSDKFWQKARRLMDEGDNEGLGQLLKSVFIEFYTLKILTNEAFRDAKLEVRKRMQASQTTVFPLGNGCMVAYIDKSGSQIFRSMPLPKAQMSFFQRYGALGQRPMQQDEFAYWYKKLVDPNTKLFDTDNK